MFAHTRCPRGTARGPSSDDDEGTVDAHQWALTVQTRRGHNKAAIAVANKLGRIVWAVWSRDVKFDPRPAVAEAA
jgi:hypothetical protein